MRPDFRSRGPRRHGRGHNNSGGNGGGSDQRNRHNWQQSYTKYMNMAREAAGHGDHVAAENCYQHAEHYYRQLQSIGAFVQQASSQNDGVDTSPVSVAPVEPVTSQPASGDEPPPFESSLPSFITSRPAVVAAPAIPVVAEEE